ncbi:MAG TPA: NTP transferase domain-containing protein [Candidatus Acidoferrales bacterium]|nr:NTP transferase domain-containing protein [Candidatus Acidoferrales bacterium]
MSSEPRGPSGISAVILAAGKSSRMGSLKQLLPLGGSTLLENVLTNLRRSQIDEIVLVLGFSADAIRRQTPLDGVKVVVNEAYGEGMGTSVRTGIAQVSPQADAALVVLADQPFVQPETIDQLIRLYRERKPQIVIPVYQGFRGNPVLLDRSVFPELLGLAGDIGCRAVFGSHTENILKAPVDDIGVLLDIDTPGDLETLRQAHAEGKAGGKWNAALLESADLAGRDVGSEPQLIVVGQEAVAKSLMGLGRLMKFTVTVVDPLLTAEQAPGADRILRVLDFSRLAGEKYVVIASRGRFDEEAVEQALDHDAVYVALVANRRRAQEIVATLKSKGASPEKLARLHAPAGLEIGAEGPDEIALSIMAQIIAERRRAHRTP